MVAAGCPVHPGSEQCISTRLGRDGHIDESISLTVSGGFDHLLQDKDRLLQGDVVVVIDPDCFLGETTAGLPLSLINEGSRQLGVRRPDEMLCLGVAIEDPADVRAALVAAELSDQLVEDALIELWIGDGFRQAEDGTEAITGLAVACGRVSPGAVGGQRV